MSALLPQVIHGIERDNYGHLWLASTTGLIRADLTALLKCAVASPCVLTTKEVVQFSTADGLRGRETSSNSHPTVCRSNDGRLWFTTPHGVVVADPDHFAPMPDAPPVVIERFTVDGQPQPTFAVEPSRVAAGHLSFQFDFAGLSLASPQKLRYAYKLQGFDRTWTDAGTRKTAYYTNIPHGSYQFLVRTAFGPATLSTLSDTGNTETGKDSGFTSGAELDFELLPHFYQRLWFRVLAVLATVSMVVLVFRRRVLRVEHEFRAVMAERNRIAREIHDTLAQGYVGISLQLEIIGELLRHSRADAASKHLSLTQNLVREGLDDARQSIWALRSQDSGELNLPVRLRRLVEDAGGPDLFAQIDIHGAYRALPSATEQEVLRIAQEAIRNVKRHAKASLLKVRLDYGERMIELVVCDNGTGFVFARQPSAADHGRPAKGHQSRDAGQKNQLPESGNRRHFGLTGIQERAQLIDAELTISSELGKGTIVTLTVPACDASSRGATELTENASTSKENS